MADKVIGGTPKTAPNLCLSCSRSVCIRGQNFEEFIYCGYMEKQMTFPVEKCNRYSADSETSLSAMEEIAWKVESRHRERAGFNGAEAEKIELVINPPTKREW